MRSTCSILLAASLLALASPTARGQDATVVRDEWTARFRGKRKVGWDHTRVEERGGASPGFVVTEVEARRTADGEARATTRVETDAGGRVLRYTSESKAPWGEGQIEATRRAEGGIHYRVQVRALPAQEGDLEECWDSTVTTLLVMRGAQPTGKRTLRCLDLPGAGSEDRELEVTRDGDRWRIGGKTGRSWRAADGTFVRSESRDRPDEVVVPATEATAADPAVAPADLPVALEQLSEHGLRVTRPGADWSLTRRAEDRGMVMLGLEHPSGIGAFVMAMPMRMPREERERLRFAETMRTSVNAKRQQKPTGEGPELGPGAIGAWRDLPGVRFAVGGRMGQAPAVGEMHLVTLADGTCAMVGVAGAEDIAAARPDDMAAAHAAIGLAPASETPWERITVGAVSLELPRDWKRQGQCVKSAVGASQINVTADRLPAGLDLRQAQDGWVERQRGNPKMDELEVERAVDDAQIDGRRAFLTVVRGKLVETNGIAPAMRAASCAIQRDDGSFVEVTIVAFDLDWDLAALDRVLASIRWIEEN